MELSLAREVQKKEPLDRARLKFENRSRTTRCRFRTGCCGGLDIFRYPSEGFFVTAEPSSDNFAHFFVFSRIFENIKKMYVS